VFVNSRDILLDSARMDYYNDIFYSMKYALSDIKKPY